MSVGLSVCPVHCEKMADQIRITFGKVSRSGPEMRQIVRFVDQATGGGNFGGKYDAPQCNQWGLFTIGNFHFTAERLLLGEFLELQACRAGKPCRLRPSAWCG